MLARERLHPVLPLWWTDASPRGFTAPLKLSRAVAHGGACELSLLHTAGGLVGGDVLHINCQLAPHSRALLTSVAAQKVYGTVGRSRLQPQGTWARQRLVCQVEDGAWLSWFPQETVVFAHGLLQAGAAGGVRGDPAPGWGWRWCGWGAQRRMKPSGGAAGAPGWSCGVGSRL